MEPKALDGVDDVVRYVSEPCGIFLKLPRPSQTLHGVLVVLGAEVALGAVFDDYEGEGNPHDSGGESSAGCPVVGNAVCAVEVIPTRKDVSKKHLM